MSTPVLVGQVALIDTGVYGNLGTGTLKGIGSHRHARCRAEHFPLFCLLVAIHHHQFLDAGVLERLLLDDYFEGNDGISSKRWVNVALEHDALQLLHIQEGPWGYGKQVGVLPSVGYQVVVDNAALVVLVLEPSVPEEVLENLRIRVAVPDHGDVGHRAINIVDEALTFVVEPIATSLAEGVAHEEQIVLVSEIAVVDAVALTVALIRLGH